MSLTLRRGNDKTWTITVKNKITGEAVDISTALGMTFTVRPTINGAVLITKTVGAGITLTDPTNGVAEIAVAAGDTLGLTNAEYNYVYDVQLVHSDGKIETVVEPSKFLILPVVTHS